MNSSCGKTGRDLSRLPNIRQLGERVGEEVGGCFPGEVQRGEQFLQVLHPGEGRPRHQRSKYTGSVLPNRPANQTSKSIGSKC